MTTTTPETVGRLRGVLTSLRRPAPSPIWIGELDRVLAPAGIEVRPAGFGSPTMDRVRAGGLLAAIIVADDGPADALAQLRSIRSIDHGLPCWLVAVQPPRQLLQIALSLSVSSVIPHPVDVAGLSRSLLGALQELEREN